MGTEEKHKNNAIYRISGNSGNPQARRASTSVMTTPTHIRQLHCGHEKFPTVDDTLQFTTMLTDCLIVPLTCTIRSIQCRRYNPGHHPEIRTNNLQLHHRQHVCHHHPENDEESKAPTACLPSTSSTHATTININSPPNILGHNTLKLCRQNKKETTESPNTDCVGPYMFSIANNKGGTDPNQENTVPSMRSGLFTNPLQHPPS